MAAADRPPRHGDGGGEPSLRAVSPAASSSCCSGRGWGSRCCSTSRGWGGCVRRLARRSRRDAAGRASRGRRALDPADSRSGVGVRGRARRSRRRAARDGPARARHRHPRRGHDDDRRAPPLGADVAPVPQLGGAVAFLAVRRVQAVAGERRDVLRCARHRRTLLRAARPAVVVAARARRRRLPDHVARFPGLHREPAAARADAGAGVRRLRVHGRRLPLAEQRPPGDAGTPIPTPTPRPAE